MKAKPPRTFAEVWNEKSEAFEKNHEKRHEDVIRSVVEQKGGATAVDVLLEMIGRIDDAKSLADFATFLGEEQDIPFLKQYCQLVHTHLSEAIERTGTAFEALMKNTGPLKIPQ